MRQLQMAQLRGQGSMVRIVCAAPARPEEFETGPVPAWPVFVEGFAEVSGGRLYYRDCGGSGPPLVLMHPATGSAFMWGHQIAAFKNAGYRVIAYSRRGHRGSDKSPAGGASHSADLRGLLDHLRIAKCFFVATAAGCTVTLDFSMSYPEHVLAIAVSSGAYGTLEEPEYRQVSDMVRTPGLEEMPADFRELGPSYRGANPDGVAAWLDLEHHALVDAKPKNESANRFIWENFARISSPVLFIAGGADLAAPPTMMRHVAAHVPNAELLVVPDAGHSVYWERPNMFNESIVGFFSRCLVA